MSALVALGCTQEVRISAQVERFAQAEQAFDAWREVLEPEARAQDALIVGGFAFDEQPKALSSHWHGFGGLRFWIPRLAVQTQGEDEALEAFGSFWVYPTDSVETVVARVEALERELAQWCERAALPVASDAAPRVDKVDAHDVTRWEALVDQAAALLREVEADAEASEQALRKVVLARAIDVQLDEPASISDLFSRLERDFDQRCHIFAINPPGGQQMPWFVGASPECLVRLEGQRAYVDALAGTMPAGEHAHQLLESAKDRHEHQLVIDAIVDAIGELGELEMPAAPALDALSNVVHLRTPITLTLTEQRSLLSLAQRLHPTPAVCGMPMAAARDFIRAHEGLERGWYTGAIGWMDLAHRGELAVAIRCALISRWRVRLYTGAGIVGQSEGIKEVEETQVKALALLSRLGQQAQEA